MQTLADIEGAVELHLLWSENFIPPKSNEGLHPPPFQKFLDPPSAYAKMPYYAGSYLHCTT